MSASAVVTDWTADDVLSAMDSYCDDVLSGRAGVGRLVRLAVERHLHDMEHAGARGFVFDAEAAAHRLIAAGLCRHVVGPAAGQPFSPEPWQVFVMASLHGWRRSDGRRRFRKAYVSTAKKNGKTFLLVSEGLYGLAFAGEGGASVFSIATAEEQARLSWDPARQMLLRYPGEMRGMFEVLAGAIVYPDDGGVWRPLGRDSRTHEGKNPSLLLVDELHAHPNGALVENLTAAMAARPDPLLIYTTTAGDSVDSYCYAERSQFIDVLERRHDDDGMFAFIAEPDVGDDWRDPATWRKANPCLGVTVQEEFLLGQRDRALRNKRHESAFRRYHVNEWVDQAQVWIAAHAWDACSDVAPGNIEHAARRRAAAIEDMTGRDVAIGIDFASKRDMSALVAMYRMDDGRLRVVPWYWLPERALDGYTPNDREALRVWAEHGFVDLVPDPVVSSAPLRDLVLELSETCDVLAVGVDPLGVSDLKLALDAAGVNVVDVRGSSVAMTPACRELEGLVEARGIEHDGNPVLRWNIANCALAESRKGDLVSPVKTSQRKRIDGVIGVLNALTVAGAELTAADDDDISGIVGVL